MAKKILKVWGAFVVVSWAAYGMSDQMLKMAKNYKESKEAGYKVKTKLTSVWCLTYDNLKQAVNNLKPRIEP